MGLVNIVRGFFKKGKTILAAVFVRWFYGKGDRFNIWVFLNLLVFSMVLEVTIFNWLSFRSRIMICASLAVLSVIKLLIRTPTLVDQEELNFLKIGQLLVIYLCTPQGDAVSMGVTKDLWFKHIQFSTTYFAGFIPRFALMFVFIYIISILLGKYKSLDKGINYLGIPNRLIFLLIGLVVIFRMSVGDYQEYISIYFGNNENGTFFERSNYNKNLEFEVTFYSEGVKHTEQIIVPCEVKMEEFEYYSFDGETSHFLTKRMVYSLNSAGSIEIEALNEGISYKELQEGLETIGFKASRWPDEIELRIKLIE